MARIFHYSQESSLVKGRYDRDVQDGVCFSMTFYVIKRMLIKLPTSPRLLDEKLGIFCSGQRAAYASRRPELLPTIEQLARRDNLQAEFVDEASDILYGLQVAMNACAQHAGAVAVFTVVAGGFGSHALAYFKSPKGERIIFDPNNGMHQINSSLDLDEYLRICSVDCPNINDVTLVKISGVPRDMGLIAREQA